MDRSVNVITVGVSLPELSIPTLCRAGLRTQIPWGGVAGSLDPLVEPAGERRAVDGEATVMQFRTGEIDRPVARGLATGRESQN